MPFLLLALFAVITLNSCQSTPIAPEPKPQEEEPLQEVLPPEPEELPSPELTTKPTGPLRLTRSRLTPISQSETKLIEEAGFQKQDVGFLVTRASQKQTLRFINPNRAFIPASVTKIFPAIAALEILGPKYRFKTLLSYRGRVENEVLKGDLILTGGNDPFLRVSDLESLISSLKKLGVRKVEGRFLIQVSGGVSARHIDPLIPTAHPYNSGIAPLSLEFNRFQFNWVKNRSQNKIEYSVIPEHSAKKFTLSQRPHPVDQKIWLTRQWNVNPQVVRRNQGSKSLPVKDPALWAGSVFQRLAENHSISIPNPQTTRKKFKNSIILHEHQSPELITMVDQILEYSNNLMTELIAVQTSYQLTPGKRKPKTLSQVGRKIQNWFQKTVGESLQKGFQIHNNSGLTTKNRITPLQMVETLRWAGEKTYSNRPLHALMPISGWKGTLNRRFQHSDLAYQVWAKTGTLYYVSGLAGYFFGEDQEKYVFAIFVNDRKKRERIDRLHPTAARLVSQAPRWRDRAHRLQETLLTKWILESRPQVISSTSDR